MQKRDRHFSPKYLLKETIEALQIDPEGIYVDCTFGGGGHSKAMLQQLASTGKLIAFDQDVFEICVNRLEQHRFNRLVQP